MRRIALLLLFLCCVSVAVFGADLFAQRHRGQSTRQSSHKPHTSAKSRTKSVRSEATTALSAILLQSSPLACGGADAPSKMQWQTKAEAKAKDRWERKECK